VLHAQGGGSWRLENLDVAQVWCSVVQLEKKMKHLIQLARAAYQRVAVLLSLQGSHVVPLQGPCPDFRGDLPTAKDGSCDIIGAQPLGGGGLGLKVSAVQNPMAPHKCWEPTALRALSASFVLVAHLLLLGATLALCVLSISRNGFVEITSKDDPFLKSVGQDWSFVWESLPTFILQFFTLLRNWPADDAAFREPFVELTRTDAKSRKHNARATAVLLDYRNKSITTRWVHAWRNRHYHLALALFLSLIFQVFLTPFSAGFIKDDDVVFNSTFSMRNGFEFTEGSLRSHSDWLVELQLAISEDVHGAENTAWTNGTHAFQPLNPALILPGARLTAASHAFAVRQACSVLTPSDFSIAYEEFSAQDATGQVTVTANDRNCYIENRFSIGAMDRPRIVQVVSETTCASKPDFPSRIVIVSAEHDKDANPPLGKLTVTSCIPLYEHTPGHLTVVWSNITAASSSSPTRPRILSFLQTGPTTRHDQSFGPSFQAGLTAVSEAGGRGFTQQVPSMFGRLVVERALQILSVSSTGPIIPTPEQTANETSAGILINNPAVIPEAVQVAFASVYRIAVARLGFQSTTDIPEGFREGLVQTPQTRLFVRAWFAVCVIAFTILSMVSTLWLVVRRYKRPCGLEEEPEGLLWAAMMTYNAGTEVQEMIKDMALSRKKAEGKGVMQVAWENWSLNAASFFMEREGRTYQLRADGLEKTGTPNALDVNSQGQVNNIESGSSGIPPGRP